MHTSYPQHFTLLFVMKIYSARIVHKLYTMQKKRLRKK